MPRRIDEPDFGLRLRHRRMERHLSQSDLATLLEEKQAYVSLWEAGRLTSMSLARLRRIAERLDVSLDYLICGPPADHCPSAKERV